MKPMTQDTATPRPSQSPTDPLDPRRSSRTSRRQSPKVIVRRQMNLTMRDRCQPIVTMTHTSSCRQFDGTVRPSWRDPHHFRQSHADRPCVLEELSLHTALKEEVEEGVVVEVVGGEVGKEGGRPCSGCQKLALANLAAFPQT